MSSNPNELQLKFFLADYATVADGKLTAVGAGWTQTSGSVASALAFLAKVPASWKGQSIHIDIALYDEDGSLVIHAPRVDLHVEMGTEQELRPGVPSDLPGAFALPPFPLVPNRSYTWRVTANGETRPGWEETFYVRAQPEQHLREAG